MKLIPALLFAISVVDATDSGAITVPFWKSPQKKQGVHKSIKNAQSRFQLNILTPSVHARSIGLQDFSDELYTTNVTFGNGQVFSVDLDTGSSDVWIRGPQCTSQDGSCGTGMPAIDLADSSIKRTGQTWQTGYGSGSVAGDIYKGRVALDTVETTLNFGVSTSETGFNSPGAGLWGLAYASINQIGGGNFVESAKVSSISFYFSDAVDGDMGELTINGMDQTKFSGSMQYVPLSAQTFYQFDPSGGSFEVDGKSIKVTDTSAIADTGTTLLLAPQQVADAVNAAIGAGAYDSNAGIYPIPCNMVTSGPPVTFKLGTVSIVMTAKEYVLQNPDGTCASGIASIGALGNGGPAYIFGDTFLRAAYTVFDVAGARLGFAQAQHPGGKVPVPVVSQATASAPSRITITKRKTRNVTATTVDTRSSGVPTAKTTEDPFPPMPSGSEVPFPPMPTDDPFPPMPTGTGDPFPPMPTSTEDPLPPMPTGSDDSFPSMPTGTEDPFPFPDTTDTGDSPFPSFKLRR